jgi:hypothetical protein
LTDFGCEQAFARAAASVQEHYGFEIGASAVRTATLEHASRAREKLRQEYEQPFRMLPAVGAEQVIAEADGTMICTVEPGPRSGKRPRQWKEMRLVAAQAKESATTFYAATFGSVEETGRRWGHCTRQAGWGLNSHIHAMGDGAGWVQLQSQEIFREQGIFLCDFFPRQRISGSGRRHLSAVPAQSLAADTAEETAAGCGAEGDRGVGVPSGSRRHGRR